MNRACLALLSLLLAAPCLAHSGSVSLCLPVSGITVDGDFSDWPDGLPRYPIALPTLGETIDPTDMEAWFEIGCDLEANALYVAIDVVRDESTVIDTSAAGRHAHQDGTDLRINVGHAQRDSTGLHHYGIWGKQIKFHKKGPLGDERAVQVAVSRRRRQGHTYEWRVDLGRVGDGTFRLAQGQIIGFDVEVMDVDAEDRETYSYYTWSPLFNGQSRDSYNFLGDVVVAGDARQVAHLSGHVGWDQEDLASPSFVSIASAANDSLYIDLQTDDRGDYALDLPVGEYRVAVIGLDDTRQQERIIELVAGDTLQVELQNRLNVGAPVLDSDLVAIVAGTGSRQGLWHTISEADGLPGGVLAIAQDEAGALWVGTTRGLFHYDGEIITRMFNARFVTTIAIDHDGGVWFANGFRQRYGTGVSHWDGETLTRYSVERGLPSAVVEDVHVSTDGTVWLGTNEGVARWRDGQFESIEELAGLAVFDIEEDSDGALLVAHVGGVRRWLDADSSAEIATVGSGSVINRILTDRQGTTWMTSLRLSLMHNVVDGRVQRSSSSGVDTLPAALTGSQIIWDMLEDRSGAIWLAGERGLLHWDGQELITHTSKDGLGADQAFCLMQDREGHLWVGTKSGLSRYDGEHVLSLRVADGLSDYSVHGMVEDRHGDLWLSTDLGVDQYDGHSVTNVYSKKGQRLPWWRTGTDLVSDGSGSVWFALRDSVVRCDGKQCRTWSVDDGLGRPLDAYRLWASGGDGVWVLPNVGVQHLRDDGLETWTTEDGLPNSMVLTVAEGNNDVWFGTMSGLARLQDDAITPVGQPDRMIYALQTDTRDRLWGLWSTTSWNQAGAFVLRDTTMDTWSAQDGFEFLRARSRVFTDAEGAAWFAADTGLLRIDDEGERLFTKADGLPSNDIWDIAQDADGVLWIGTPAGLSRYDGRVFRSLTRREGLAQNGVSDILQTDNGDVWVATLGGVTRLRPRHTPPGVRLVSVLADKNYGAVETLRVPAGQSSLRFEFRGRSLYTAADDMVYLYRLHGVDDDWRQTTSASVEYADLTGEPVRFEVMAVDVDLNYSEPVVVDIAFDTAWAQYTLYGGLGLSLLGVVLASSYGLRNRRAAEQARQAQSQALQERNAALEAANQHLREMDELKSDFVSNVSHELRTPLTSIKGSVDNMLDGITGELNDKQARYLNRVQGNANRLSRLVDDLLDLSRIEAGRLELRPTNIDVAQISRDVVGNLQTLAAAKQIQLHLATDGQAAAWADADRVHQVLVNLVGNAVKFTPDDGQVHVRVAADSDEVTVAVSDTGPGIAADQLQTIFDKFHQVGSGADRQGAGLGLAISQRLVELHGGTLHVDSEVDVGSTFTFTLPVRDPDQEVVDA